GPSRMDLAVRFTLTADPPGSIVRSKKNSPRRARADSFAESALAGARSLRRAVAARRRRAGRGRRRTFATRRRRAAGRRRRRAFTTRRRRAAGRRRATRGTARATGRAGRELGGAVGHLLGELIELRVLGHLLG